MFNRIGREKFGAVWVRDMKISRTELAAAGLSIAFFAFIGGYFWGQSNISDSVTISTQYSATAAAATEATAATNTGIVTEEPSADPTGKRLNINTASIAELETLPGIGEVLASRIVEYRQQNGDYRTIYDITSVKGIGEKTLEAIESLISVG